MSRRATQLVRWLVRCNAEARDFDSKILESELWRKKPWHSNNTAKADSPATGLVLRGATVGRLELQASGLLMTNAPTWIELLYCIELGIGEFYF